MNDGLCSEQTVSLRKECALWSLLEESRALRLRLYEGQVMHQSCVRSLRFWRQADHPSGSTDLTQGSCLLACKRSDYARCVYIRPWNMQFLQSLLPICYRSAID